MGCAKCDNCHKEIESHPADSYKDIEVFCSFQCAEKYYGKDDGDE